MGKRKWTSDDGVSSSSKRLKKDQSCSSEAPSPNLFVQEKKTAQEGDRNMRLTRSVSMQLEREKNANCPSTSGVPITFSAGDRIENGTGDKDAGKGPSLVRNAFVEGKTSHSAPGSQLDTFQKAYLKALDDDQPVSSCDSSGDRTSEVTEVSVSETFGRRRRRKSSCPKKKVCVENFYEYGTGGALSYLEHQPSEGECREEHPASSGLMDSHFGSTGDAISKSQVGGPIQLLDDIDTKCTSGTVGQVQRPLEDCPQEPTVSFSLLTDKDPLLGDAPVLFGEDVSQVPSSSQTGPEDQVMTAGLRFHSLQDAEAFPVDTCMKHGNGTSDISSGVINTSVTEERDGVNFDNLLPGLNMLHVGRRLDELLPLNNLQSDPPETRSDKVHRKKSKLKKHKHKSPHKSKTSIASPSRKSKRKKSASPMKSPEFELVMPVSNWTSLEKPVGSSLCSKKPDDIMPQSEQLLVTEDSNGEVHNVPSTDSGVPCSHDAPSSPTEYQSMKEGESQIGSDKNRQCTVTSPCSVRLECLLKASGKHPDLDGDIALGKNMQENIPITSAVHNDIGTDASTMSFNMGGK